MLGVRKSPAVYVLAMLVIPLVVWTTLAGLLLDNLYKGMSTSMLAQARGQDLVTLAVAIPVTFAALVLSFRGSLRGYLLLLGQLGYYLYTYLTYAVFCPGSRFFLLYVIIFSLSLYGLASGIAALDLDTLRRRFARSLPRRLVGGYLVFVGLAVAVLWLSSIVIPTLVTGELPRRVVEENGGVLIVQVLDLGVVAPLGVLAGVLLWLDRAWGYALASVILIKGMTLVLAVLAMILFMHLAGVALVPAEIVLFCLFFLVGLVATVLFLRAVQPEGEDD